MHTRESRYSNAEDDFLRENYRDMTNEQLARSLNRTPSGIQYRLQRLGLKRGKQRFFTEEEDQIILNSAGRSSVDVAAELGRSPLTVRLRARRLGITSWKDFSGGFKDLRGYKTARIDQTDGKSRRVPVHRDVMSKHLGRDLTSEEVVHHINCRKDDNNINNLYLCANNSIHRRAHYSVNELIPYLLEMGIIYFDRNDGIYRLATKSNQQAA